MTRSWRLRTVGSPVFWKVGTPSCTRSRVRSGMGNRAGPGSERDKAKRTACSCSCCLACSAVHFCTAARSHSRSLDDLRMGLHGQRRAVSPARPHRGARRREEGDARSPRAHELLLESVSLVLHPEFPRLLLVPDGLHPLEEARVGRAPIEDGQGFGKRERREVARAGGWGLLSLCRRAREGGQAREERVELVLRRWAVRGGRMRRGRGGGGGRRCNGSRAVLSLSQAR